MRCSEGLGRLTCATPKVGVEGKDGRVWVRDILVLLRVWQSENQLYRQGHGHTFRGRLAEVAWNFLFQICLSNPLRMVSSWLSAFRQPEMEASDR